MSQKTGNSAAFIEANIASQFILDNLHDGLLPEQFVRNVSDFQHGTTLDIKTIGTATLQEVSEDSPLVYNPIDSGTVQLQITDFVGDAWYITDVMRQDGHQTDQLMQVRSMESARAIQEYFETRLFSVLNDSQTASDLNNINGQKHRFVASGTNQTLELDDLIQMKLSFDKANVPQGGRIAIVDPIVEATMNTKFNSGYAVDRNPQFMSLLSEGFVRDHKFVMNMFGFDIFTSNRLPRVASETIDSVVCTTGVANIFMSALSDQTRPGMVAWRQLPQVETERNKDHKRDEFVSSARWGVGVQRQDTLGVILTDETSVE